MYLLLCLSLYLLLCLSLVNKRSLIKQSTGMKIFIFIASVNSVDFTQRSFFRRGGYLEVSRVSRVKNYTKYFQKKKTRRENQKTKHDRSSCIHYVSNLISGIMLNKSCSSNVQMRSEIKRRKLSDRRAFIMFRT